VVAATTAAYFPTTQLVQAVEPTLEKDPAAHEFAQLVEPVVVEYMPAEHLTQEDEPEME